MSGFGKQVADGLSWSLSPLSYQFITTLQENTKTGSILNGSAVAVTLSKTTIGKASATGSTLEHLPRNPDDPLATDTRLIARVRNVQQDELIPEPSYYGYADVTKINKYTQLLYSWASTPGVIFNAGYYMLSGTSNFTDKGYDLPPTILNKRTAERRTPDSDWNHDACVVTITSEAFGSRRFIVMVDASSTFHCWPTQYENLETEYLYPVDSPYIPQGIKTNVAAEQTISVTPPFPDWVYVPVGERRDTDWPSATVNSGEPKYVWRFHPKGTKVVGTVLRREQLVGTVRGEYYSADPNEQLTYLPFTEVEVADTISLHDERFRTERGAWADYSGPPQTDWPGLVEFSIDITVTGPNPEEFAFALTLAREQAADATHYLVAADYLSPALAGTPGEAGDLIVLDLASYIDSTGELQIARNCGYLGDTKDKVRQTWGFIKNVDRSNSILRSILLVDQPTNYDIGRFKIDAPTITVHRCKLLNIKLSMLSFTYFVKKSVFTIDADGFADGFSQRQSPYWNLRYILYRCNQRHETAATGLRVVVFNEVVQQYAGESGSPWSTLDNISVAVGMTRISPVQKGTRWLESKNSYKNERHWLTDYLGLNYLCDYAYESGGYNGGKGQYITGGVHHLKRSDSARTLRTGTAHIRNSLLSYLKGYSSSTTGEEYTFPDYTESETLLQERDGSQYYGLTLTATTGSGNTNIVNELSVGCSTCDSNWFDTVLIPWTEELYSHFMTGIASVTVTPNAHDGSEYDLYLIVDEQEVEFCTITYYSYSVGAAAGYHRNNNFINYDSIRLPFEVDAPVFYSKYDTMLSTFTAENLRQRIYDYEIGAEWMMTEWQEAIEVDANFTLMVAPEGFYAGHCWLPYYNDPIPNGVVLGMYDNFNYEEVSFSAWNDHIPDTYPSPEPRYSAKDEYVLNGPVGFLSTPTNGAESDMTFGNGCSRSHVIKNDAIARLAEEHYLYQYDSEGYVAPQSSNLSFVDCDFIGHIDGASTSHGVVYERAYQHALDIESPTARVTTKTTRKPNGYEIVDVGYVYEKGVNYSADTLWSPAFSELFGFMAPRKNGAMLFSK